MSAERLRPLFSDEAGGLHEADPGWEALGQSGANSLPLRSWIPLPRGATVMHLPHRVGLARPRGSAGAAPLPGWAVTAVLPVGYLRLLFPSYLDPPPGRDQTLPLYGYAAVAARAGQLVVAARRSDDFAPWTGARPSSERIRAAVEVLQRRLPRNRVVAQLSVCALQHGCLTAQNTFLRRHEGALPTSAACNADCLGCISLQSDSGAPTPQPRIPRAPTAGDLIEVGEYHLSGAGRGGEGSMVSFGQGCEGEPLLRERALRPVVGELRRGFPRSTIHVNTNGSRPLALRRLIREGLDSCRISVFSFRQDLFAAYYRPRGYSMEEVLECARVARREGAQLTLNLLTFPGVTDSPEELELTLSRLAELEVEQLQLRSLNVDPHWLLSRIPPLAPGVGLERMLERLRRELPRLRLGNFTRPRRLGAGAVVGAGL